MSNINKVRFTVDGIHCPNCAGKIKTGVEQLSGISEVVVEQDTGLVEVSYQAQASSNETIKAKIETLHGGKFTATIQDSQQ